MYISIKNLLDIIFSMILLILLSPLFILVALLMKILDPGPIFFKQKRVGKEQKVFLIYKFRTMVVNADKIGPLLTTDNDPRITKLGKFLRHSSIDELPQFINVIKGEMMPVTQSKVINSNFRVYRIRICLLNMLCVSYFF